MRSPPLPLNVIHVEYGTDVTSDRPQVQVKIRDTETQKKYHATFWKYEAPAAGGIVIRDSDNTDATTVKDTGYWALSGYGGAGRSNTREQLAFIAAIQLAADHLRYHDDLNIKLDKTPTDRQREPEYVWFGTRGGQKRHLAAARDSTSFCGNVNVGYPNAVDDDFDVDSYRVCKTCRKKYRKLTETDD